MLFWFCIHSCGAALVSIREKLHIKAELLFWGRDHMFKPFRLALNLVQRRDGLPETDPLGALSITLET